MENNIYRSMRNELSSSVGEIMELSKSGAPILDGSEALFNFCRALERLLKFGLKDRTSYWSGATSFWNYIEGLAKIDETDTSVATIKMKCAHFKTSIGMGRAWIRYALAEKLLYTSLKKLFVNVRYTKSWYDDDAIVLQEEQLVHITHMLNNMCSVNLEIDSETRNYNLDEGWAVEAVYEPPPPAEAMATRSVGGMKMAALAKARKKLWSAGTRDEPTPAAVTSPFFLAPEDSTPTIDADLTDEGGKKPGKKGPKKKKRGGGGGGGAALIGEDDFFSPVGAVPTISRKLSVENEGEAETPGQDGSVDTRVQAGPDDTATVEDDLVVVVDRATEDLLAERDREIGDLKKALLATEMAAHDAESKHREEVEEVRKEMQAIVTDNDTLRGELAALTTSMATPSPGDARDGGFDEPDAAAEVEVLRTALAASQRRTTLVEKDLGSMTTKLAVAVEEVEAARAREAEALNHMEEEKLKLMVALEEEKLKTASAQEEIARQHESQDRLQATLKEALDRGEEDRVASEGARAAAKIKEEKLREELETFDELTKALTDSLNAAQQEAAKLSQESNDAQVDVARLEESLQWHRKRIADVEAAAEDRIASLEEEIADLSSIQRDVWVDERTVLACGSCTSTFNLMKRKHHCRNCGNVFCHECSTSKIPTSSSKKPVRVCDGCYTALLNQQCSAGQLRSRRKNTS